MSEGKIDKIVLEEVTYKGYVDNIDKLTKALLNIPVSHVEPDSVCLQNVVIPDYQTADHAAIDTIIHFRNTQVKVVRLMNKVLENYQEVNDELERGLQNATGSSGSSEGD